jgi:hypothetical protein
MANTKKEWANMSAWEKFVQIFVNVVVMLIPTFCMIIAYCIPVECKGLDAGVNIWCLVHPGTVADVIGWILLWFGAFWLSGIWGYFIEDDDEDPWKTVTKIAWCCAIAGPTIITLW